jgi:hypothetical protein
VGAFAVAKKNGKQRLVIDARIANLHFEPPEKVRLATGSTFSMVEVDDGPAIEVGRRHSRCLLQHFAAGIPPWPFCLARHPCEGCRD